MDCIASIDYYDDNGMACKVVMPSDPSMFDIDVQFIQPDLDENLKILDQWGEQDGNIVVSFFKI